MMETEKSKRIEQILATDVTREQLAEALWCAESSQRMWHGCAEKNRSFRLKAEAENAKLLELVAAYDSALHRLCDQTQGHVDCDDCILGKDYRNEDICALDELRDSIMGLWVEVDG